MTAALPPLAVADPYDEDGYCHWCGNGRWKFHGWECAWADAQPLIADESKAPPRADTDESKAEHLQNLRSQGGRRL